MMINATASRQVNFFGRFGNSRNAASKTGNAITMSAGRQLNKGVPAANTKYESERRPAAAIFAVGFQFLSGSAAPKPRNHNGASSSAKLANARGKSAPSNSASADLWNPNQSATSNAA